MDRINTGLSVNGGVALLTWACVLTGVWVSVNTGLPVNGGGGAVNRSLPVNRGLGLR